MKTGPFNLLSDFFSTQSLPHPLPVSNPLGRSVVKERQSLIRKVPTDSHYDRKSLRMGPRMSHGEWEH